MVGLVAGPWGVAPWHCLGPCPTPVALMAVCLPACDESAVLVPCSGIC